VEIGNSQRHFYGYLIIINFLAIIGYFYIYKHLPPPFFYDLNDTFMDYYHVLEWSSSPDIYTEWKSIYLPFSFVVAKLLGGFIHDVEIIDSIFKYRLYTIEPFLISYASLVITIILFDLKRIRHDRLFFVLFIYLTSPFLFAFERGNLILITYFFLSLSIYFSNKKIGVFF